MRHRLKIGGFTSVELKWAERYKNEPLKENKQFEYLYNHAKHKSNFCRVSECSLDPKTKFSENPSTGNSDKST